MFSTSVIESSSSNLLDKDTKKNHPPIPVFPANGERLSFATFLKMTIVLNLSYPFG